MKNAFMIAATGSGCGKTTITCSLLKALGDRQLNIKAYKCGPDYIDPMFHKAVLGIESENLDLFFSDREEIREIFYGPGDNDVCVVEGVMGLYDGVSVEDNAGSSYDLACKLDIPVVLVVNARGMGRSILALIRGFLAMDEQKRIKGVILNQISQMFYETVSRQIEEELGIAVIGYFPRMENINLESRYLGLKMPGEVESLDKDLELAAGTASKTIDIDRLLGLSKANDCDVKMSLEEHELPGVRIAVARDEAFCFFYEENMKLLRKLGAELVEFSPLHDTELPKGIDGLLLGGGYPELHAQKLSSNTGMLRAIKEAIESGIPSLAECGGFMYLHDVIRVDGNDYPMVGVINGSCEKKDRLVRFGYLTICEKENRFVPGDNRSIKGHEFHYYDSTNNGNDAVSTKPGNKRTWEAAHITENHWWGFAHLYYPSNIDFAKAFVAKCRESSKIINYGYQEQ